MLTYLALSVHPTLKMEQIKAERVKSSDYSAIKNLIPESCYS